MMMMIQNHIHLTFIHGGKKNKKLNDDITCIKK